MTTETTRHRGYVLLADDDDAVRKPLATALEHAGFMVGTARDGFEAARELEARRYDVVLADINMPGNQRLEFVRGQRSEQTSVPIVIITGYPSLDTAIDALRLGVVDYITKPIDPRLLFVRLDEAIQKGRLLLLIDETDRRVGQLSRWLESLRAAMHASVYEHAALGMPVPDQSALPSEVPVVESTDTLSGLSTSERQRLSQRETDVLKELAHGRRAREAAENLGLSVNTVRNHLKSIFVKLGVTSQVELMSRLAGHR